MKGYRVSGNPEILGTWEKPRMRIALEKPVKKS